MIKHLFIFLFLVVSYATLAQNIPNKNILHFYVGTYTDSGSEGIYRFGLIRNPENCTAMDWQFSQRIHLILL